MRGDSERDAELHATLADPRRRAILDFVRRARRAVNRDEVAEAVGLSRPLTIFHLERLLDVGLLRAIFARPEGRGGPGAGRPAKWYEPSPDEFELSVPPRRYVEVGVMLASAIEQTPPGAPVTHEAQKVARAEGERLGRELRDQASKRGPSRRDLVALLNEIGFEPATVARDAIELGNCPFHRIAQTAPDLVCGMNEAFMQGLLDGAGLGGLAATLDPAPDRCCVVIGRSGRPN